MVELLQHYSLSEILTFTIFLALAIKSLISFFDWGYEHVRGLFDKEHTKLTEKEKLQQRLSLNSEMITSLKANQENTDETSCYQHIDLILLRGKALGFDTCGYDGMVVSDL